MNVPGVNLLSMASRLVKLPTVPWLAWLSNTKDVTGTLAPTYAAPVDIQASVQAVTRAMYVQFGLDMQKSYVMLYTLHALRDLNRNVSCDQIIFAGRLYDVESLTDWSAMDSWQGALCVDVGSAP